MQCRFVAEALFVVAGHGWRGYWRFVARPLRGPSYQPQRDAVIWIGAAVTWGKRLHSPMRSCWGLKKEHTMPQRPHTAESERKSSICRTFPKLYFQLAVEHWPLTVSLIHFFSAGLFDGLFFTCQAFGKTVFQIAENSATNWPLVGIPARSVVQTTIIRGT